MPPAATHIPLHTEANDPCHALSLLQTAAKALESGDSDTAARLTLEAFRILSAVFADATQTPGKEDPSATHQPCSSVPQLSPSKTAAMRHAPSAAVLLKNWQTAYATSAGISPYDTSTLRDAILHLLPIAWRAVPLSHRIGGYLRLAAILACATIALSALAFGHHVEERLSPAGVTVTYYRGTQFEHRVCRRTASELSVDYQGSRPAFRVPAEGFSARWNGWLIVPTEDTYTFLAQSMDGIRVKIDGATVLDRWIDQEWEGSRQRWDQQLTQGPHRIEVEHYSREGHAAFMIRWTGGGIDKPTVLGAPFLRKRLEGSQK